MVKNERVLDKEFVEYFIIYVVYKTLVLTFHLNYFYAWTDSQTGSAALNFYSVASQNNRWNKLDSIYISLYGLSHTFKEHFNLCA